MQDSDASSWGMVQPRALHQRTFTAAVLLSAGAFAVLGAVLVHATRSPEAQQFLRLVAARCTEHLGEFFRNLGVRQFLAFSVPAAIAGTFTLSMVSQARATSRFRRTLPLVPPHAEPKSLQLARQKLQLPVGWLQLFAATAPLSFCLGMRRPVIYLSTGAVERLTEPELAAVLAHERHHRSQRDPLRSALLASLGKALFFLPALRVLHRRYAVSQEVAADAAALQTADDRFSLVSALQKLARGECPYGAVAAFASRSVVAVRVAFLAGRPLQVKPLTVIQLTATAAVLVALLAYLTPPSYAGGSREVHCASGLPARIPVELPPLPSQTLMASGFPTHPPVAVHPQCVPDAC